jgi:hypothetical protein
MPQDQVGFDAELLQVQNAFLEMAPEGRIGPGEIELAVRALLEGEQLRFVAVVSIALGNTQKRILLKGEAASVWRVCSCSSRGWWIHA